MRPLLKRSTANAEQITLPPAVREHLHPTPAPGDVFDIVVLDNTVTLTLRPDGAKPPRGVDIGPWIGSAPGRFKDSREALAAIANDRASWDD